MEPADNQQVAESVPKGGESHPVLLLFAPFGDGRRELLAIRRFHSLRSFHQRLFTFAPFGDGRHELPAFPDSSGTEPFASGISRFFGDGAICLWHFPILRGREVATCVISAIYDIFFLAFRFSKNLQVSAKFNRNNLVVSDN